MARERWTSSGRRQTTGRRESTPQWEVSHSQTGWTNWDRNEAEGITQDGEGKT